MFEVPLVPERAAPRKVPEKVPKGARKVPEKGSRKMPERGAREGGVDFVWCAVRGYIVRSQLPCTAPFFLLVHVISRHTTFLGARQLS